MNNCKKSFAIVFLIVTSGLLVSCSLKFSVAKLYSGTRLGEGQAAYFHTTPVKTSAEFWRLDGLTSHDIYRTKEHFLDGSLNSRRDRTTSLFELIPGKHTAEIHGYQLIGGGIYSKHTLSVEFEAKAGHIYSPEITVDQKNGTFSAYVLDITDMDFRLKESTLNSIKASYPSATP